MSGCKVLGAGYVALADLEARQDNAVYLHIMPGLSLEEQKYWSRGEALC